MRNAREAGKRVEVAGQVETSSISPCQTLANYAPSVELQSHAANKSTTETKRTRVEITE